MDQDRILQRKEKSSSSEVVTTLYTTISLGLIRD